MWRSYVRRVWGGANFNGWEGLALPSPLVLAPLQLCSYSAYKSKRMFIAEESRDPVNLGVRPKPPNLSSVGYLPRLVGVGY